MDMQQRRKIYNYVLQELFVLVHKNISLLTMFSAVTIFETEDHLFSYLSGYFATLTVLILFSKYSAITAN